MGDSRRTGVFLECLHQFSGAQENKPRGEEHGKILGNTGPQTQTSAGSRTKIPQPLCLPKGSAEGLQSAWHKVGTQ